MFRIWILVACLVTSTVSAAPIALALHGGAGTILRENMTPEQEAAYRTGLQKALKAGYSALAQGESAEVAVLITISLLEDDPHFNAGRGAVMNYNGQHEMDASIMLGDTHQAGAVAGVKHIRHPIKLAQAVMEDSPHVMLSGAEAEEFALTRHFKLVDNHWFTTPKRYQSWLEARQKLDKAQHTAQQAEVYRQQDWRFGTVGAVALDRQGNLAAGTSTGGMTGKRWGRIGDSPIIGAGTWADNDSCAVSATGHGEFFIRFNVAADICNRMKYKAISADQAAHEVIDGVLTPVQGEGGVIVVDKNGNVSTVFNSSGMYRAYHIEGQQPVIAIYQDDAVARHKQ